MYLTSYCWAELNVILFSDGQICWLHRGWFQIWYRTSSELRDLICKAVMSGRIGELFWNGVIHVVLTRSWYLRLTFFENHAWLGALKWLRLYRKGSKLLFVNNVCCCSYIACLFWFVLFGKFALVQTLIVHGKFYPEMHLCVLLTWLLISKFVIVQANYKKKHWLILNTSSMQNVDR